MALLKKKSKEAGGLSLSGRDISEVLAEYAECSEKIKFFDARKKELANDLKELALKTGREDEKGSYYCESGDKIFGRVRKCKVSLDEDKAIAFFKNRGILKDVVKTVIDEDKVSVLVDTGEITAQDVESISNIKETFSFYVGNKPTEAEPEEMPTVEVGEKKPKRRLK